jgi:hypothetical protein
MEVLMKNIIFVVIVFFVLNSCVNMPPSEDGIIVPLDRAIREAAQRFKAELDEGTTVAVLKFNSLSPRFDDYVMQEMELALVGGKRLIIKERKHLQDIRDLINSEYQSGYVSDETLVSIAKEVGTQVVVVGDLFDMNDTYRFRIRAVMNETATIETAYAVDLHPNERKVRNLMNGKKPQKIQLAETVAPGFFERNKKYAQRNYWEIVGISLAWGEVLGFGSDMLNFYFSPLPYVSLGIGFQDGNLAMKDRFAGAGFLPIRAGVLFPITEKITFMGYGTLHWLGQYYSKINEETEYNRWLIGSNWIGITPGIRIGLLYFYDSADVTDTKAFGLSFFYKGYWIKDGYISSVGIGFCFGPSVQK